MSRPDGRYSLVEVDRDVKSDAETVKSFHSSGSIAIPVVVLTTLITAAASVLGTYFATRNTTPVDCASRESVTALDGKLEQLNTRFSALTEKVIADSERQHNDIVDLKLRLVEQNRNK